MEERLPADIPPAEPAPTLTLVPPPSEEPPVRRRSYRGAIGLAVALVLAFVWGVVADREIGARATPRALAIAATAVKGAEAPPGWMGDFASAFCGADAQVLAPRLGPPLTGNIDAISQALDSRDWTCSDMRYIGTGTNPKGTFFVYVMRDKDSAEQWWVFTVMDEKVVAIE